MRKVFFLLLLGICLLSCKEKASKPSLHYSIKPIFAEDTHALSVSLDLKTGKDGIVKLFYQDNQWGEDSLFRTLTHMETIPPAHEIRTVPDSSLILIRYKPNETLTFRYRSIQDIPGKTMNQHTYRPIVQENYFHTFGNRLFIYPHGAFTYDSSEIEFIFDWEVPQGFLIHNSFGCGKRQRASLTQAQFRSSVFVGGDFRRYSSETHDNEIHFLTRGEWIPFEEEEVNDILTTAIRSHKRFWQDYSDSMYSVTMIPTHETQGYSLGGTGLTQSFATFISNNKHVEMWRVKYLFFHELLHNWIGHKIENRDEELQYWFSEGFTDYYTYKLMLRNGVINEEEFIKYFNKEVLELHYKSPVSQERNDSITYEKFWSDKNYEKLPYRRGMIYAFYLDNQIKLLHDDLSLDNLMRDILDHCHRKWQAKFDHALFKDLLLNYLPAEEAQYFDQYIEQGWLIKRLGELPQGLTLWSDKGIPQLLVINGKGMSDFLAR